MPLSTSEGIGWASVLPLIQPCILYSVLHAPLLRLSLRMSYFALSMVAGYLAAPELIQWLPIHERGISAFIASAAVITLTHKGLDALNKLDVFDWLKRRRQSK